MGKRFSVSEFFSFLSSAIDRGGLRIGTDGNAELETTHFKRPRDPLPRDPLLGGMMSTSRCGRALRVLHQFAIACT